MRIADNLEDQASLLNAMTALDLGKIATSWNLNFVGNRDAVDFCAKIHVFLPDELGEMLSFSPSFRRYAFWPDTSPLFQAKAAVAWREKD